MPRLVGSPMPPPGFKMRLRDIPRTLLSSSRNHHPEIFQILLPEFYRNYRSEISHILLPETYQNHPLEAFPIRPLSPLWTVLIDPTNTESL